MKKQTLFSVNSDTQKSAYIAPSQKVVELDVNCMLMDGSQENDVTGPEHEDEETEGDDDPSTVKFFRF